MNELTVKAWEEGDGYVLNSSINPNAFFKSDSTGIFKQIFISKKQILSQPKVEI